MKKVTILGLGAMGARMAKNFLDRGYQVSVWNRSSVKADELVALGASSFSTPQEAASQSDIVIAMLTNDEASKGVWLDKDSGAIHGLNKGAVVIECSTLSLGWCLELAASLKAKDIAFLDAPVVGSRPQVEAAQLIHLVGGDIQTFETAQEVLTVNAAKVYHIGKTGAGISFKLAVNGLFGMQVAALGEMLGMLNTLGVSNKVAVELLNELPTTSPALKGVGMLIAAKEFAPLFPISLVEKDFKYLEHLSASPLVKVTREVYQKAMSKGYGADNIAGVSKLYL